MPLSRDKKKAPLSVDAFLHAKGPRAARLLRPQKGDTITFAAADAEQIYALDRGTGQSQVEQEGASEF